MFATAMYTKCLQNPFFFVVDEGDFATVFLL